MTIKTGKLFYDPRLTPEQIRQHAREYDRNVEQERVERKKKREPVYAYMPPRRAWLPEDGPNVLPMSERGFGHCNRMPPVGSEDDR